MSVNPTEQLWRILQDSGAIRDNVNLDMILISAFNTTQTVRNSSITLFAIDALGGSRKDVKFGFYLAADAAATFTVAVYKTRAGDLITFTQDLEKTWVIVNPAAAGVYTFEAGDLEEGLQMEIRVAQDNAGNANNACDATLTYLGSV